MDDEKRDTVGKISLDLQKKAPEATHSAEEQMREQLSDYEDHMQQCVNRCKKEYDGDFYIVVLTKKERLMQNVIRNFFMGRKTCPTPEYDQAVYKYNRASGIVEFMWVIPAKDVCMHMLENALILPPEESRLLSFVMDFNDGSLLRKVKIINGEAADSNILVKG
jgi:hypothetical protein